MVFAVAGTWRMDGATREPEAAILPRLFEGVSHNDGFIRGFWSKDVVDRDLHLTFVVLETLTKAEAFRDAVLANAPAQAVSGVAREQIRIVEVEADA